MLATRYEYAASLSPGKRVLEIGCGSGQGLGLLAEARLVVGSDIDADLLRSGVGHYGPRVPFVQQSADALAVVDRAFDLLLFFEASYYVPNIERAFDELARVAAPGAIVVFVNANPERPDFIKSPHSHHYHSADEFRHALEARGFEVLVEAAYPVGDDGLAGRAIRTARRLAEFAGLVPQTLRGRALLKRLLFGRPTLLPPELPVGFAPKGARDPVAPGRVAHFKVLYITARKRR